MKDMDVLLYLLVKMGLNKVDPDCDINQNDYTVTDNQIIMGKGKGEGNGIVFEFEPNGNIKNHSVY